MRVEDPGVAGGTVPGVQLYPKEIRYTGFQGTPGLYAVTFVRDRELPGWQRRPDVTIDARGGFKVVTADLLRRIDVTFKGQLVRGYTLQYQAGAFTKTLLASVTQFGEGGPEQVFHTHRFEYYDEVRNADGSYHGFDPATGWNTGDDKVRQFMLFDSGRSSAINGMPGLTRGGHFYVGFRIGKPTKLGSAGAKIGYTDSRSRGAVLLADLNGDGLPDKVVKDGGKVFYRPNRSGPSGTTVFGDRVEIPTLPAIAEERSVTTSLGPEASAKVKNVTVNILTNFAKTFSHGTTYFADVNGDGRTDLVHNGQVLFGSLDGNGHPVFSPNSVETGVPVGPGAIDATDLIEDFTAIFEERIDTFPLLDTVRRWVAPFDGQVQITGTVALIQDPSEERQAYTKADGVRVAIQHNATERWATTIGPDDSTPRTPTGVEAIPVQRGDRLYFRVQSVFDGAFDQVAWAPEIRYLGVPTGQTDVNGLDPVHYQATADFVLAGRPAQLLVPVTGTLHLAGDLLKQGVTTDDVTLTVLQNGVAVLSRTMTWDATGALPLDDELAVTAEDTLELRVRVDSPIDLSPLAWTPQAFYVAAEGVDAVQAPDGIFPLQLHPAYDVDLYPATDLTAPQAAFVAPWTGTLLVTPQLTLAEGGAPAEGVVTVKRPGALAAKQGLTLTGGPLVPGEPLAVPVTQGDALVFDVSSRDPTLLSRLTGHQVTVRYADEPDPDGTGGSPVPSALHAAMAPDAFPQPYRGWAVAGYNGTRDRASQPLDEAVLVLDESYALDTARVYVFTPWPEGGQWRGPDEKAWVAADRVSASRLGPASIEVPRPQDFAGARAPSRLTHARQTAFGAGAGIDFDIGLGISASGSFVEDGTAKGEVDFVDLNGDQYPDVVGLGRVQYTGPTGGLEPANRPVAHFDMATRSTNASWNFGMAGNYTLMRYVSPRSAACAKARTCAGSACPGVVLASAGGL